MDVQGAPFRRLLARGAREALTGARERMHLPLPWKGRLGEGWGWGRRWPGKEHLLTTQGGEGGGGEERSRGDVNTAQVYYFKRHLATMHNSTSCCHFYCIF